MFARPAFLALFALLNVSSSQPLTRGFYTNMPDSGTTLAGYRKNYGANLEQFI